VPEQFKSQENPIEGVDTAAEAFFQREQRRNAIKMGNAPMDTIREEIPEGGYVAPDPETPVVEEVEDETALEAEAVDGDDLGDEVAEDQLSGEGGEEAAVQEVELEGAEEEVGYDIPADTLVELPDGTQVTYHEMQRGFLREKDYTQKNQELARQRQDVEAEYQRASNAINQRAEAIDGLVNQLQSEIQQVNISPQYLEQLRQTDPAEYAAVYTDMQRKNEVLQRAHNARAQLQNEAEQRVAAQRAAKVPVERAALQAAVPAFEQDFDTEYANLGRYILDPDGGGLRQDEWDLVDDHRYVRLCHKAMLYDEATRKKLPKVRKKIAGLPRAIRPGVQRSIGDTKREEDAAVMQRLKDNPESKEAQKDAWLMREKRRSAAYRSRAVV